MLTKGMTTTTPLTSNGAAGGDNPKLEWYRGNPVSAKAAVANR